MSIEYHSNKNVVYSCKYHVVWCPKYRRKVLVNGVDTRLKELIHSICQEIQVDIIEMEIMPDHIHLLIEVDPQFGIHKAVKTIKGKTSHVLREEFPWLKNQAANAMDEQLFCFNRRWCSSRNNQAIYRKSEDFAKEVRTWKPTQWGTSTVSIQTRLKRD